MLCTFSPFHCFVNLAAPAISGCITRRKKNCAEAGLLFCCETRLLPASVGSWLQPLRYTAVEEEREGMEDSPAKRPATFGSFSSGTFSAELIIRRNCTWVYFLLHPNFCHVFLDCESEDRDYWLWLEPFLTEAHKLFKWIFTLKADAVWRRVSVCMHIKWGFLVFNTSFMLMDWGWGC